jgi:hypothetical protein
MIWFVHFWVIVMHGDKDCVIIASDDDITRIIRTVGIAKEKVLRIRLFMWIFLDDFPCQDNTLDIG